MIDPKAVTKALMVAKLVANGIGLGKPDALDRRPMYAKGGEVDDQFLPHSHPQREQNLAKFMEGAHPSVLNEDGTPKVFYHGTNKIFSNFDTNAGVHGGLFFTSNPDVASEVYGWRAESHVMPVHVNLKNPLKWNEYFKKTRKNIDKETNYGQDAPVNYFDKNDKKILKFAKENGHDGIYWPADLDSKLPHDLVVAFHPHQIKSAVGNRGTYDPNEKDIDKAKGGEVDNQFLPHGHPERAENLAKFMEGAHPSVLNEDGTPRKLFHATASEFSSFNPAKAEHGTLAHSHIGAGWFTDDSHQANYFGRETPWDEHAKIIMPIHVSMKNPYILEDKDGKTGLQHLSDQFIKSSNITDKTHPKDIEILQRAFASRLKAFGHDGILIKNTTSDDFGGDNHRKNYYLPFDANQIKSATGNRGTYSPTNDDITKANGGEVDDMFLPHGHPQRQENLANFMRHAHRSVLNEDGSPRVFFHGTKRDFSEFKPGYDDSLLFVTTNPKFASKWPVGTGGLREPSPESKEEMQRLRAVQKHIESIVPRPKDDSDEESRRYLNDIKEEFKRHSGFRSPYDYEEHAGTRVMPVHVSSKNPFNPETDWQKIEPFLRTIPKLQKVVDDGYHKRGNWLIYEDKDVINHLKKMGHDAVWLSEDTNGPAETLAVFNGNQIKSATGNRGTYDIGDKDITKAEGGDVESEEPELPQRQLTPQGLYSGAAQAARNLPQDVGSPQQMIAMIKRTKGVRDDEIRYSGVEEAFAGKPRVTKEEVAQHFEKNLPTIREYDSSQYQQYSTKGGENYRAKLLQYAPRRVQDSDIDEVRDELRQLQIQRANEVNDDKLNVLNDKINSVTEKYAMLRMKQQEEAGLPSFYNNHWSQPNVLLHMRMTDRLEPRFAKTLAPPKADRKITIPIVNPRTQEYEDKELPAWSSGVPGLVIHKAAEGSRDAGFTITHEPSKLALVRNAKSFWAAHKVANELASHIDWTQPKEPVQEFYGHSDNRELNERRRKLFSLAQGDKKFAEPDEDQLKQFKKRSKTVTDGFKKHLLLDELQSDWGQKGRDIGWDANEGTPEGPWVTSTERWTDLGLKRALYEAARDGHDTLAWAPAIAHAKRYPGLSSVADLVMYEPERKEFNAYKNGRIVHTSHGVNESQLRDFIGKENASQLLQSPKDHNGVQLIPIKDAPVGERVAGMRKYYEGIVPKRLIALAQEHDPEAKIITLQSKDKNINGYPALPISKKMRESILKRGFPAFRTGGEVHSMQPEKAARKALMIARTMKGDGGSNVARRPKKIVSTGSALIAKNPALASIDPKLSESGVTAMPLSEMSATHTPKGTLEPWKEITPEQLQRERAIIFPAIGDRTRAGVNLTHVGDVRLAKPVDLQGGGEFTRSEFAQGEQPAAWASTKGAARKIASQIQQQAEEGAPAYLSHTIMGPHSGDASHMMAQALLRQIPYSKIAPESAALFDEFMRKLSPQWPGILNHKKAEQFLLHSRTPLRLSAAFAKEMDKARWLKAGFPDVGQTRFAILDPRLIGVPSLSSGFSMARVGTTGKLIESPKLIHQTYTGQIPGEGYAGGMRNVIPVKDMFPDWWARQRPETIASPAKTQYAMTLDTPAQKATQEWLDNIMTNKEIQESKWGYAKGGMVPRTIKR